MPRGVYKRTKKHLEILERGRVNSIKSRKGKPPWSKGLTKNEYPNLANCHRKSGFKHSDKTITLMKKAKIGYTPKNMFKKGHKFPKEIYDKIAQTRKKNPYKHKKEDIEKIKKARAKQILPLKDTKIELKIQDFLTALRIEFVTHKYMNIKNSYQCDIFIPIQKRIPKKTIIECDGNFIHCNPIKYSANFVRFPNSKNPKTAKEIWKVDNERTKQLIAKGFRVLRLWENEIKIMTKKQLNKLVFQACGDTVRPCFEFEKMQDKASVCEAGNYREISRRSP